MKNKRKDVITRKLDSQHILIDKLPAEMIDISNGGLAINKNIAIANKFSIGKCVSITFLLNGEQVTFQFIVRNINEDRIGCQYFDGKTYNPQQRLIIYNNRKK